MEIQVVQEPKLLDVVICFRNQEEAKADPRLVGENFEGKFKETLLLRTVIEDQVTRELYVGIGAKEELTLSLYQKVVARAIRECQKQKMKTLTWYPLEEMVNISMEQQLWMLTQSALLAEYRYSEYRKELEECKLDEMDIVVDAQYEDVIREGICLGESTIWARNLINAPANSLTPITLAQAAERMSGEAGVECEILDEIKIQSLRMNAYYQVAKGSTNQPRLIILRYMGNPEHKEEIFGLVGKGITYDSGGYSLKSKEGMLNMRSDMGGAAAVLGAMRSIAMLKSAINVVAVIPACENLISHRSYKPGDIIETAGKSIFIKSTDAEGRLTIIDGLTYIIEHEHATRLLDIATLTGAAVTALGSVTTAVISNDDEFYNNLEKASALTGEKIWRMPTFEEYKELLQSDVADLTNSPGQPGMITAGLFIAEFNQGLPWIHMDIAGTSWADEDKELWPKGATGVGVRTLFQLVCELERL